MQLAARIVAALAFLAFATPALPCGDRAAKTVTAQSEKPAAGKSEAVAKTSKKAKSQTKPTAEQKPATAAN